MATCFIFFLFPKYVCIYKIVFLYSCTLYVCILFLDSSEPSFLLAQSRQCGFFLGGSNLLNSHLQTCSLPSLVAKMQVVQALLLELWAPKSHYKPGRKRKQLETPEYSTTLKPPANELTQHAELQPHRKSQKKKKEKGNVYKFSGRIEQCNLHPLLSLCFPWEAPGHSLC